MGSDRWSRSWPSSTVSPKPPLHVPAAPHTLLAVFVPAVPEFRALVGDEAAEELRCSVGDAVQTRLVLKKCFTRMMNCEKKLFVDQLNMLVKRVTEEGEQSADTTEGTSGSAQTCALLVLVPVAPSDVCSVV